MLFDVQYKYRVSIIVLKEMILWQQQVLLCVWTAKIKQRLNRFSMRWD